MTALFVDVDCHYCGNRLRGEIVGRLFSIYSPRADRAASEGVLPGVGDRSRPIVKCVQCGATNTVECGTRTWPGPEGREVGTEGPRGHGT